MAASVTAIVSFLLVLRFSISDDQRIIRAEPGDNVILTCRAAENKDVKVVEWSRTDLESDQYVLLYRNNQSDPEGQSPSFRNRADLLDVENGDVSLVLKKVTTDDTGRYKCRVVQRGDNRRKIQNSVVNLRVEPARRIIPAEPGDNVILPCRPAENKHVIVVEWRRTDLESDQPVLLYRDSQLDPEFQSPSFSNRVDLLDVNNGDVSLVLKKVKIDDTGTYECRVDYARNNRRKRSINTESISIIDLRVEAGNEDGLKEDGGNKTGLIIGLSVFVLWFSLFLLICTIGCRSVHLQDLTNLQHQKLNLSKLQQYRKNLIVP